MNSLEICFKPKTSEKQRLKILLQTLEDKEIGKLLIHENVKSFNKKVRDLIECDFDQKKFPILRKILLEKKSQLTLESPQINSVIVELLKLNHDYEEILESKQTLKKKNLRVQAGHVCLGNSAFQNNS